MNIIKIKKDNSVRRGDSVNATTFWHWPVWCNCWSQSVVNWKNNPPWGKYSISGQLENSVPQEMEGVVTYVMADTWA